MFSALLTEALYEPTYQRALPVPLILIRYVHDAPAPVADSQVTSNGITRMCEDMRFCNMSRGQMLMRLLVSVADPITEDLRSVYEASGFDQINQYTQALDN